MACAVMRRESSARSRSMRLRAFSKSAWRRTMVWRISLRSAWSLATLPSRTSRSSSSLASAEEASPADGSSASGSISISGSGDFFLSFSNTLASSSQKLRFVERLPEQLRLVGKLGSGGNLRRALHVHLLRRGIRQQGWIAKSQGVAGDLLVALALLRQLGHQIAANGLQRPARVMRVQVFRGAVEIRLGEIAFRTEDFVARGPAGGDQHDHHSAVGKDQEPQVLEP